jgi:hypothetical protein
MLSAPLAADASATQIAASMPLARSSLFHSATLERFSADIDFSPFSLFMMMIFASFAGLRHFSSMPLYAISIIYFRRWLITLSPIRLSLSPLLLSYFCFRWLLSFHFHYFIFTLLIIISFGFRAFIDVFTIASR